MIIVVAMKLMVTMIRQITRLKVLAMVMMTEIATTMVAVQTEMILILVLVTAKTRLMALTMERAMVMKVVTLMEVVTLMVVMMVMIRPPMMEAMTKVILKAQARNPKRQEASWALSSSLSESSQPVLSDSLSTASAVRGRTISMTTSKMEAIFKAIRRST